MKMFLGRLRMKMYLTPDNGFFPPLENGHDFFFFFFFLRLRMELVLFTLENGRGFFFYNLRTEAFLGRWRMKMAPGRLRMELFPGR